MSDTFITIMAIIITAVVLFIVPVMATANQNDNITQTSVQALVSEFVNTSAKEGKITLENYDSFVQKLYATGNSYSVEMEVQIQGENVIDKTGDAIGENIYYSEYTTTILDKINNEGAYKLKQGDRVIAKVQNTNVTMGTHFKNFIYKIMGRDTIAIEASAAALVTVTGR